MRSFNFLLLQNRYIPALLLIAVLATAYYINDVSLMSSLKNEAKIINLSGKQRMYSQRLVVLSKNYLDNPNSQNLRILSETLVTMKKSHFDIKKHVPSHRIKEIYESGILDKKLEHFDMLIYDFIKTPNETHLNKISVYSQELLELLDEVVMAYESASSEKIAAIEKKERYIYSMILLVLIFEAIFIFYPASRKIAKNTQALKEAIKDKTKELQKSIDIISDYVIYSRTDLKGIITYASKEFSNVSGFSNKELVGAPHNIVRHPDVPKDAFEQMWKTIKQGKTWRGEVKNRKKDGGYYWVDANISPEYDKNGKIIGYAAVRHNITFQKEIEELNENLELRIEREVEKNRKKDIKLHAQAKMIHMSEMIGNIAHQWRQPLSAISVAAGGLKLKKELGLLSDEEYVQTLDKIIKNTKELSSTIDTFSGFINNKPHRTAFCLQEQVHDTIEIIQESLTNNNIKLHKRFSEEEITVTAYESLLSQALLNIMTNAKEVLLKREIQNPWISINVSCDEQRAKVIVSDNAGGIDEDKLSKIFDPYFTTKHQSVGTGMGLHNSYNIVVNDLNGELYAQNSTNGAQFFMEIPLQ